MILIVGFIHYLLIHPRHIIYFKTVTVIKLRKTILGIKLVIALLTAV